MGRAARVLYAGILGCFALIAIMSALLGMWFWTAAAVALGVGFSFSGLYVLGGKWRPPEPKPRSRPVTRRRK